ncbi:MAG: STAS domain-containing protein [Planctomycetes bacterium]|nr:STAS domain-containing protein [Planctomycetota bacterium]
MSDERTHLSVRTSGGVSVVEFADRKILDELSINEIGEELSKVVAEGSSKKLLLSFKNVDHLSSAALGMLIRLNKQVAEVSGSLKLAEISPQIFEVFKITGLNKIFEIHPTTERALAAF